MQKIDIIAVGKMRKKEHLAYIETYQKRIISSLNIIELDVKQKNPNLIKRDEGQKILRHIKETAFVITMDEHGKNFKSIAFAKKLQNLGHDGYAHFQFIIGGADGLSAEIKTRANLSIAFGQQTWPHMMVRIMLLEQIYRAQQILSGHPYHRA